MSIGTKKDFYKSVVLLAFPIAMQNLLVSCASLIDTAMVLQLGNTSTSAVGLAGRFSFLLNVIGFGFCSGAATLISQFWGAREYKNIKKTYGLALSLSLVVALLFAISFFLFPFPLMRIFTDEPAVATAGAEYLKYYAFATVFIMFSQMSCASLRATERVLVPLVSSFVSVIVNTFFNYCLISGNLGFPRLEVKGAAIATTLGAIAQALVVFFCILFGNSPIKAHLREYFGQKKDFVYKYIKVGAPVLLNETVWAVGTNVYLMVLARQGTDNHSAFTVYDTFQQLFFVFFVGVCNAAAIMIGKKIGEGDKEAGYLYAKRFLVLVPLLGIVIGAVMLLLRFPILNLIKMEDATRQLAATILVGYSLWLPAKMLPYTAVCGVFRAGGDTKTGCIIDFLSLYLVGIPTVVFLGFYTDISFPLLVLLMYVSEDVPKIIMCARHFFTKRWIIELSDKGQTKKDGGLA